MWDKIPESPYYRKSIMKIKTRKMLIVAIDGTRIIANQFEP
jgi:hypothetical protein